MGLLAPRSTLALSFLFAATLAWSQDVGLRIILLEGEDGVNIIQKKTAVKPLVEVRDKNDLPVAGASVTFMISGHGKTAVLLKNLKQLTVTTDRTGRATISELRPLGKGAFQIQVKATYQGQTATATIHQTNFATVADATQAGKVPGSSQSAQSGQSAGESAGSSSGGGAAGAAGASAAAGAGGGLSGAAMAAVAVGAAGAGIGTAVAVKHAIDAQNKGPDCTSLQSQLTASTNAEAQVCAGVVNQATLNNCLAAYQTVLNTLGQYCACAGPLPISSADRSSALQSQSLLRQLGYSSTLPSSCGF